jgi:hypothetical protein
MFFWRRPKQVIPETYDIVLTTSRALCGRFVGTEIQEIWRRNWKDIAHSIAVRIPVCVRDTGILIDMLEVEFNREIFGCAEDVCDGSA